MQAPVQAPVAVQPTWNVYWPGAKPVPVTPVPLLHAKWRWILVKVDQPALDVYLAVCTLRGGPGGGGGEV